MPCFGSGFRCSSAGGPVGWGIKLFSVSGSSFLKWWWLWPPTIFKRIKGHGLCISVAWNILIPRQLIYNLWHQEFLNLLVTSIRCQSWDLRTPSKLLSTGPGIIIPPAYTRSVRKSMDLGTGWLRFNPGSSARGPVPEWFCLSLLSPVRTITKTGREEKKKHLPCLLHKVVVKTNEVMYMQGHRELCKCKKRWLPHAAHEHFWPAEISGALVPCQVTTCKGLLDLQQVLPKRRHIFLVVEAMLGSQSPWVIVEWGHLAPPWNRPGTLSNYRSLGLTQTHWVRIPEAEVCTVVFWGTGPRVLPNCSQDRGRESSGEVADTKLERICGLRLCCDVMPRSQSFTDHPFMEFN